MKAGFNALEPTGHWDGIDGTVGSRTVVVVAGRYPGAEGDGVRGGTDGATSLSG